MPSNVPRYTMSSGHGDLPKGKVVFLSMYHQSVLDGHRMVTPNPCGKGAAYSVPEGLLVAKPYDDFDQE